LEVFQDGREASETWLCSILPFLSQPLRPDSEVDIRITPGIRRLVQTAFQQHGGSEYAGLEILHVDTFSDPRPFGWETHPRNSWEIREERGERSLHLLTPGSQGAIRAPTAYALLRNHEVSDFVFSGRIRCLADPDNPHRDMLVVFNFQDPFHFYYIHFSAVSDEVHNIIGLVNGSDRIKINLEPAGGSRAVLTDRMYHHFKVVYAADSGNIRAFLDDMNTPLLTAQDKTLGHGRVGVGSFDDTGSFTSIVLWGTRIQEKE